MLWSIVEMSSENVGRGRMITKRDDLDRVDFDPVNKDLQWRRRSVTVEKEVQSV